MTSQRAYILWLDPDLIVHLLGNWRNSSYIALPFLEECADMNGNRFALPKDCNIVDATYDWQRKQIGVRLEHPSFPEVPPGQHAPSLIYTLIAVQALPIVQDSDGTTPFIVQKQENP